MAEKADRITLSKPVIGFIVAGLVVAFGSGVAASFKVFGEAQAKSIPVLTAGVGPDIAAAVTTEQVRQLMAGMAELRGKLDDTIKQVGDLNARLARLEGELAGKHP